MRATLRRELNSTDQSTTSRGLSRRSNFFLGLFTGAFCSAGLFAIVGSAVLFFMAIPVRGAVLESPVAIQDEHAGRPIGDIRRDVKAYVKNSKQDDDMCLQVGSVVDLCQIHREIVFDARYQTNKQLQSLRAQVATRLKSYSKEMALLKKRLARAAEKEMLARKRETKSSEKKFVLDDDEPGNSKQQITPIVELSEEERMMAETMTASFYSLGRMTGGPTQVFEYLSGNFAPPGNNAEQLIDLIERTIAPDHWKSNGGDAVIQQYDPLCILVVSGTAQMHDQLTDFLHLMRGLSY